MKATLFGPLRLEDHQQRPSPLPPTANGRTLLAYLLLHTNQAHGRTHLATLLAPDDSEDKARRALTQALWQIRRALPDGAILTVGDTIQLDGTHIQRDVAAFDSLMADTLTAESLTPQLAAQLADGVALYRADLLNDLYDDWVYLPREQRRERFLRALELLAAWEKQNGRFPAALDIILKLTQADPLRESAQREALRLYAALNRPQAARRHYDQFRRYLHAEMGLPPDPQTQQLANAIANAAQEETAVYLPANATSTAYALSDTTHMPLIGRELERSQLIVQLNHLSQGQGGLIFLSGAPGVGKSRLLQELSRDAEWRGLVVGWGNGRELDAAPPYALFREALGELLTPLRWQQLRALLDDYWLHLAQPLLMNAEQGTRLTDYSLRAADHDHLEALSRLLLAIGQLRPLLLILDDVQWGDTASLEAIIYLSHRLRQQPLLVVLAFRSIEARADTAVWQSLNTLDAAGPRLRLSLEPLTPEATAEFISQGLGLRQEAPLFSQSLFAETQGSPLLLLESLRLLHDEGLLYRNERGEWRTPYDNATSDYAELRLTPASPAAPPLLERRLQQLPAAAQHTLQLAAVMGRDVQFGWLLAATEQPQAAALAALGLLVQRQFLQETPHAYRFSHDKIREAAYAQMSPEQRVIYHGAIAAVMAGDTHSRGGDVAQIAYHYRMGERWSEALYYTLQAAEQAHDLHALTAALDSYALARQILEEHHPLDTAEANEMLYRILVARQPLLFFSGQTAQQAAELADLRQLAAQLPDPALQADALLKEADYRARVRADSDTAVSLAQQVLELAQQHNLPRRAAEAWGVIGDARQVQGAFQESAAALQQAAALQEASGDNPQALTAVYSQLLYAERLNGRWAEGKALAEKLLALAEQMGDPMAQGNAHVAIARFYTDQSNHVASAAAFEMAVGFFQRIGARLNEARALANLGYSHWALRHYAQAIEMQEDALLIFHELDNQKSILLSYLNLATLYDEVGQTAQGAAYTAQGLALARQLGLQNYELALQIVQAQALVSQGALAEGAAILDAVTPLVAVEEELHTRADYWLVRGMWLVGNGRYPEAISAYVQAADLFAQEEYTDFVTAVRSFQALALWQMGEQAPALSLSATAVAALEESPGGEFIPEIYWHHAQICAQSAADSTTSAHYVEKAYAALTEQAASLPESTWMEAFWARPVYQAIRTAWEGQRVQRVQVWLPKLETAKVGRTAVSQLIAIEWTPDHPDDAQIANKVARRRQQIARLLSEAEVQGARATIAALAEALDSSQPTIKRDLAALR
ncbi:MAG: AAA family ATPase [Ardenticatenaceae bacterium]|nr:AAA family ATPase [Ardenticatenaceae bacterium]MCB9004071.1 AAA family ATPase [Ardenticatenaceae bacterium]